MFTAISVESLSKVYRLGQIGTGTLTYDLQLWWARARGKPNPLLRIGEQEDGNRQGKDLWALKDVSFSVEQGEVLGIIGRNGAGKSTLLKVLSRVTAPTNGRVKVRGRIASLLEVGTGFHPELTGRENIYLNGAILGMTKEEVRRKFDQILDFAEVEKFIDTPVKRYSSGMYVRLAFAVAAHLEPEILLVDEVLAVGDAEFQKKCLGKMGDVAKEGRTVLFVSHNMGAIASLCRRALCIHQGQISWDGISLDVIQNYLQNEDGRFDAVSLEQTKNRSGIGGGFIDSIEFLSASGIGKNDFGIGEPVKVRLGIRLEHPVRRLVVGLEVKNQHDTRILNLRSDSQGIKFGPFEPGKIEIEIDIPGLPLYPGSYYFEPWIAEQSGRRMDHIHERIMISLVSMGHYKSEMYIQNGRGVMFIDCHWKAIS